MNTLFCGMTAFTLSSADAAVGAEIANMPAESASSCLRDTEVRVVAHLAAIEASFEQETAELAELLTASVFPRFQGANAFK